MRSNRWKHHLHGNRKPRTLGSSEISELNRTDCAAMRAVRLTPSAVAGDRSGARTLQFVLSPGAGTIVTAPCFTVSSFAAATTVTGKNSSTSTGASYSNETLALASGGRMVISVGPSSTDLNSLAAGRDAAADAPQRSDKPPCECEQCR